MAARHEQRRNADGTFGHGNGATLIDNRRAATLEDALAAPPAVLTAHELGHVQILIDTKGISRNEAVDLVLSPFFTRSAATTQEPRGRIDNSYASYYFDGRAVGAAHEEMMEAVHAAPRRVHTYNRFRAGGDDHDLAMASVAECHEHTPGPETRRVGDVNEHLGTSAVYIEQHCIECDALVKSIRMANNYSGD